MLPLAGQVPVPHDTRPHDRVGRTRTAPNAPNAPNAPSAPSAPTTLLAACAAAVALAGCAADAGRDDAGGDDSAPAVETVAVPESAIHRVGTSDLLSRVADIEIASDGTIWVLDAAPPFFVGFDTTGAVVASMGERGGGPNEFQSPAALVRVDADSPDRAGIWAYDGGRNAVIRIAGPDGPVTADRRTIPFPADSAPRERLITIAGGALAGGMAPQSIFRPWIDVARNGFLALRAPERFPDATGIWRADVVTLDFDGGTSVSVSTPDHIDGDAGERYPGASRMLPYPIWAACADGGFALYDPLRNHVARWTGGPGDSHTVALPPERGIEFSPDRLYDLLLPLVHERLSSAQRPPEDELRESFDEEVAQYRDAFADVFPEYTDMRCADDDGSLWLQRFAIENSRFGRGRTWLRVPPPSSPDRTTVREIRFPDDFDVLRLYDGRAWGVRLDALDVPHIVWTALP